MRPRPLGHALDGEGRLARRLQRLDTRRRRLGTTAAAAAGGEGGAGGGTAKAAVDAKKIFNDAACGGCHTLADAGTSGAIGPDLDKVLKGKDAAFIKNSIEDPSAEIAKGFQDIMPKNYGDTLSPEELDALVEYLGKVAGK